MRSQRLNFKPNQQQLEESRLVTGEKRVEIKREEGEIVGIQQSRQQQSVQSMGQRF